MIVLLGLIAFNSNSYAQNSPNREIGIRLTGLEDFDFVYKKENRENRFFRHRLGSFNIWATGNDNVTLWNFGLGYAFGVENRTSINEKLKFIHGFEPGVAISYGVFEDKSNFWNYQLSLGYVLGFQYDFAESFYVNIETIPALTFKRSSRGDNNTTYSFNAGFSSNAVALTLAYRF